MYESVWEIKYYPDFPDASGLQHVFWAIGTGKISNGSEFQFREIVSMHEASGCMIDHESRMSDLTIPDEIKFKFYKDLWGMENLS